MAAHPANVQQNDPLIKYLYTELMPILLDR